METIERDAPASDTGTARNAATTRFKAAMGSFAAGVTIITAIDDAGTPQGMTATAFSSVSVSPPLCLVCVNHRARTCQSIVARGCFAVNLLCADQHELSARFASSAPEKYAGVSWVRGATTGCPLLTRALARIECVIQEVHAAGDHCVIVGQPLSIDVDDGSPLVYWRGRYSSLTDS